MKENKIIQEYKKIFFVDAYLYTQNGERLGIHRGGNRLDCSNVPPGEYNLFIKTEYEPSNEGEARFLDRVKVV